VSEPKFKVGNIIDFKSEAPYTRYEVLKCYPSMNSAYPSTVLVKHLKTGRVIDGLWESWFTLVPIETAPLSWWESISD